MNLATVKRLEKALAVDDGTTRMIVGLQDAPGGGFFCDACGKIHATTEEAERAHPGPGVLFVHETIVGAAAVTRDGLPCYAVPRRAMP